MRQFNWCIPNAGFQQLKASLNEDLSMPFRIKRKTNFYNNQNCREKT